MRSRSAAFPVRNRATWLVPEESPYREVKDWDLSTEASATLSSPPAHVRRHSIPKALSSPRRLAVSRYCASLG
jgi:hypothetical protein